MKRIIFLLLFFSCKCYAQDSLHFSKRAIDSLFQKLPGQQLFNNAVLSSNDVLKVSNTVVGKSYQANLSKFAGALLTVAKLNNGKTTARIIKGTELYYELEGEWFVKKESPLVHYNNEELDLSPLPKRPQYSPFLTQREQDSIMLKNGGVALLVDFNGHTVAGTSWSATPIVAAASTINGITSSMDSVMTIVKNAYAPFAIVVIDSRDTSLYFVADAFHRKRVIQTPTYGWYGAGAGGVSYLNSLAWGDETPSWSFDVSGTEPAKEKARIIVHEMGHCFGLNHTALTPSGYGTGTTSIRPIMFGHSLTGAYNMQIWWKGTDQNGSIQDDIDRISKFQYRRSEAYSNPVSLLRLTDVGRQIEHSRLLFKDKVQSRTLFASDSDFYKIELVSAQTISITVDPINNEVNPTLDIAIDLYDESKTLIASSSNTTVLNATLSQAVSAGVYFIKVRPDRGNANNTTGYGFIGTYNISFTY